MNLSDSPNLNCLWSNLLVEHWVRSGIEFFCLAPGSRSTPLVHAVAGQSGIRKVVHWDERGSAFCALGYARATGKPAVWITTSGTAVAHGFPAIIEAAQDHLPLIMVTADRPPELRDTGSNQTIDQSGIFDAYVKWSFDLPCPCTDIPLQFVLSTAEQARYRATASPSGPVHLNCMFREPLAPVAIDTMSDTYTQPVKSWMAGDQPYTRAMAPARTLDDTGDWLDVLSSVRRGILSLGHLAGGEDRAAAERLAGHLGWPVFPDIRSGLRFKGWSGCSVHYYDQILLSDRVRQSLVPDGILHIGGSYTSKRLMTWLGTIRPRVYVHLKDFARRQDPEHVATLQMEADLPRAIELIVSRFTSHPDQNWNEAWSKYSVMVNEVIEERVSVNDSISEPGVARVISRTLSPNTALFLGSSMPVRDMDMFGVGDGPVLPVGANRGASGIDGTVASCAGFARGLERPVVLVVGDVAMLHDLNSLGIIAKGGPPVILVVINNDGGGIFNFLPVSESAPYFEEYFGTPHGLSFEKAAEMFGITYQHPCTLSEFQAILGDAQSAPGSVLIEVDTNRVKNLKLHREIEEAVVACLHR